MTGPTEHTDLVWSSNPCQPFSSAGLRLGAADPRDGFPWLLRIVTDVRPRVVIAENVPRVTSHGAYFAWLLNEFRQLGYSVDWKILNAADWGVPQKRWRLFVIGRLDARPVWPLATHAQQPGLLGERPWVTMAAGCGWTSQTEVRTVGLQPGGWTDDPDRPTNRRLWDPYTEPAPTVAFGHDIERWRWVNTRTLNGTIDSHAAPAPALTTKTCGQWVHHRPATVVTTRAGTVPHPGRHDPNTPGSQNAGVRITLAEAAALQGFPPGLPWDQARGAGTMIGNAVPPVMAEVLIRSNRDPLL